MNSAEVRPRIAAVVPARLDSTRFPRKVLHRLAGKPMILWTLEAARKSQWVDDVIAATDSDEVADVCHKAGFEVIMTGEAASGSDRVAQAAKQLDHEIILNIQADEPLLCATTIDTVLQPFLRWDQRPAIVSAAVRCTSEEEFVSNSNVKVTVARNGHALYFSRSPIPWGPSTAAQLKAGLIHQGIYAYWRDLLLQVSELEPVNLEKLEKLEQLRFLDYGIPVTIMVVEARSIGVDTPEEAEAVEQILLQQRST